jgi:plastocyanin
MSRIVLLFGAALTIAATVTACGSSSTSTTTTKAETATSATAEATAPATAPAATITIGNFMFNTPESVPAGATIAVKNSDQVEHSVTADTGNTFNIEVDGGETKTFTAPSQPGSYPYHCSYHPMMHGTLVVK